MIRSLIGIKKHQTQEFTADGARIPVTVIHAGPCFVTATRSVSGKDLVELGYGQKKHMTKPLTGHISKAGLTHKLRFLRSFPIVKDEADEITPGREISVTDVFSVGDKVKITGVSKGKGFAGVVKRHGFAGGPRTHGQSDRERAPGSIGQTTTPGRVYRGKRMAGRMGTDTVTVRGLSVVGVDNDTQTIRIKGVVPGPVSGQLVITKED